MDTEYDNYVTPSGFDDDNRMNYSEGSNANYSYYVNTRTGEKVGSFSRTKSVYVRLEGSQSEEAQESRVRDIKNMISLYDDLCKTHDKDGSVTHVYLVLRQEKKYCGIRTFAESRSDDPKEDCGFSRQVDVITQTETDEKDADKSDKPGDVLPMALSAFLQTLQSIDEDERLEKYKKKCYWVHVKHPMSAIYFSHEINYMRHFGYSGKNGGDLKYVDVIEKINRLLEKMGSVVKGDVNFYECKNMIDGDALSFYQEPYAFVPDPEWLAALKKTKNYKYKSLIGTDLSALKSNRQGNRKSDKVINRRDDSGSVNTRPSKRAKK